jgi:hypothetical protein
LALDEASMRAGTSSGVVQRAVAAAGGGSGLRYEISLLWRSDVYNQHAAAITGLCWREASATAPEASCQAAESTERVNEGGEHGSGSTEDAILGINKALCKPLSWQLGTCGRDHAVRVFHITT